MGASAPISCRFFGPLTLERLITDTDVHGNVIDTKDLVAPEIIQGKIERNERVQSGDAQDQVDYSYQLFTNEVLELGWIVENRAVVNIGAFGEYTIQ